MATFRDSHKVCELLAPAGGPEQFYAALTAGADAIYCALGNDFNARRSATNFTYEEFRQACRAAHIAGVRVFVPINIVIKHQELPRALALVKKAYLLGADAFIIQDWGLLAEIRRRWPEIECHISTQANVHDVRTVEFCKRFGVQRVTLSRELTVAEIAELAKTGVELESFGHGALCFCYSGICQLSSLTGARSANRGQCAQPCRLPYDFVDEKGRKLQRKGRERALCPKDFSTIHDVGRLNVAGLSSLKIEGRMKSADYVYAVVSAYRSALDAQAEQIDLEEVQKAANERLLKRAFNRGFTNSYLDGHSDDDMMSYERSNNRGELVGEVVSAKDLGSYKEKRFGTEGGRERFRTKTRAEVVVKLTEPVGKGDLIELRHDEEPNAFLTGISPDNFEAGEQVKLLVARPMPKGAKARVIRSQAALDAAARIHPDSLSRKRDVNIYARLRLGEPFLLEMKTDDGNFKASLMGFVCEPARSKEVTREDIKKHLGRLGQSPFSATEIVVDLEPGIGLAFSQVHELRRLACEELVSEVLAEYDEDIRSSKLSSTPDLHDINVEMNYLNLDLARAQGDEVDICVLVSNDMQVEEAKRAGIKKIYANPDVLAKLDTSALDGLDLIPYLDEVYRKADQQRNDFWIEKTSVCLASNMGEVLLLNELNKNFEVASCIPAHNASTLNFFASLGAVRQWLNPELSLSEIEELSKISPIDFGMMVYGYERAMTSEHCILQTMDACIHDCQNCRLRRQKYYLRNHKGELLRVTSDVHGRSRLYAPKCFDACPEMKSLISFGVTRFMIDLRLFDQRQIQIAISYVSEQLKRALQGQTLLEREDSMSEGHLYLPIG